MAVRLIDTHSHIYEEAFEEDFQEVLDRAERSGIYKILLPNVDCSTIEPLMAACEHSESLYPMMGLHPTSVKEDWQEQMSKIREVLYESRDRFCAVGEIGIDLYWDRTFVEEQKETFRTQMLWAEDLSLPVSVHSRKAFDELYAVLKQLNKPSYKGVMHCFGGDLAQANKLMEMGFLIGIGGVLTFKNAHLAEIVKHISLDKILLETDAPYLAPVPFRGKRNESAYILNITQTLAQIKQVSLEEVAEKTTSAALTLFPKIA